MTDKNRQKGNESVGEKSDGLVLWQIMVAGPAGYVRREAFAGSSLAEALENVRKQGFAWVEDYQCAQKDGSVDVRAQARIALLNAYRDARQQSAHPAVPAQVETFDSWLADNMPSFQRQCYSADDVARNCIELAQAAWDYKDKQC